MQLPEQIGRLYFPNNCVKNIASQIGDTPSKESTKDKTACITFQLTKNKDETETLFKLSFVIPFLFMSFLALSTSNTHLLTFLKHKKSFPNINSKNFSKQETYGEVCQRLQDLT